MEEHPLLDAVTKWPGRGPTQLAFEALGFSIHRARQNEIIQFCGEQQSDLLNRYWDELAIETMQSLGKGDPDQRAFTVQPKYRSTLLDELFAARDFAEPSYPSPPLVKCVFEHFKSVWLEREFREHRAALFSRLQQAESERLGIDTAGGLQKKQGAIPFLEQFCVHWDLKVAPAIAGGKRSEIALSSRLGSGSAAMFFANGPR